MKILSKIVESKWFQGFVLGVILLNAVVFGLQTSQTLMERCGATLNRIDQFCLVVFTVELVMKLIVYNRRFCRDAWNIFDFVIVAVSFVPDMGMLSSLRLFRVLRVFKLISGVRPMRVILGAILKSIPGVMWSASLLGLIYYVYGIIGTMLFGKAFPDWFGTLGRSLYSLFQIMTMESWSMGISRPVMEVFPYAWVFFVSFIVFSAFIVMNVVLGIVLSSISDSAQEVDGKAVSDAGSLEDEFAKLKKQLEIVERLLQEKSKGTEK